ncbi:hypothetical protein DUNSADRAFT_2737 [Dunaliella salina]|nr:hypothetical protein DUNSADRAFT_2737 [Dunaliella salina]KAF5826567.1 hypothetical protein DUNSADRAFT_2737 [Dunaliella salina]|eukprot:KAF5826566.1 hypothetical protein DUNSADRAFT_2737 [Dunaliella salina]
MRELKPRPKHAAVSKAHGTASRSRGGATRTSAGAAHLSARAGREGGKVEVSMGNASKAEQVAGKQQHQQHQQHQQQGGERAPLVPCPYLMAQPPAAVRRDFRDFMRSACEALRASEPHTLEGAGAAATVPVHMAGHTNTPGGVSAPEGAGAAAAASVRTAGHTSAPVGLSAPAPDERICTPDGPGSPHEGAHDEDADAGLCSSQRQVQRCHPVRIPPDTVAPDGPGAPGKMGPVGSGAHGADAFIKNTPGAAALHAGSAVPLSGHLAAAAVADNAVQYDLESACARMEGWALAHSGNLEETGKTLGVLEGLLCGVEMPAWVMEMVQRLLCNIRATVHARYGVHLLPL